MEIDIKQIKPVSAFTLYEVSIGYGDKDVILLKHDFRPADKGQGVEIGAGSPISIHDLIEELDSIKQMDSSASLDDAGFVPKGVFYMTQSWIGWEVPARPALLRIKRSEIMVPMPRLLMFSNGADFRVCAVRHRAKLEPKTPVFHAPLLNVYSDGRVCWGSVQTPKTSSVHQIDQKAWESALFDSIGTHINHPHTLTLTGDGRDEVNTAQYEHFMVKLTREKQFPNKNLAAMNMTLGEFTKTLKSR